MKKLLLLLLVVVIYSCQNPNGTVTTNDERSKIIKTLFKNVSEENIDYLKEVFSDEMTFVDARNNTKDKTGQGLIKAVGKLKYASKEIFVAEANLYNSEGKEIGFGTGNFTRSKIVLSEEIGYK